MREIWVKFRHYHGEWVIWDASFAELAAQDETEWRVVRYTPAPGEREA